MSRAVFLESFEGDEGFAPNQPRPEDLPGYADGYAAGQIAADAAATRISADIASQLTEIQFGYAEARQDLLRGLTPLVNVLCDQILPDILDDVTSSHIFETLLIAAQTDVSAPITLSVHPRHVSSLKTVIESFTNAEFCLVEDPNLGAHEALIGTRTQETQLDTAALLDALKNALSMIVTPEMRYN